MWKYTDLVMEHLKTSSSKWLKTQGVRTFSWQRGYGAFSVSQSNVASVVSYIEKQEEHHRTDGSMIAADILELEICLLFQ